MFAGTIAEDMLCSALLYTLLFCGVMSGLMIAVAVGWLVAWIFSGTGCLGSRLTTDCAFVQDWSRDGVTVLHAGWGIKGGLVSSS